jgi:hypothetical protein
MSENMTVSTASNTHSNLVNSPSVEVALVNIKLKGGYPFIPKDFLYIPNNLDIDEILQNNPPEFNYCRDRFVFILDLIYSLPSRKKKTIENYTGFTPINKTILGGIIKNYRAYIDYLKSQNIVKEGNYVVGEKSQGLRFVERYRTTTRPIEIKSWTLIKNYTYLRKGIDNESIEKLLFLKNWFNNKLTIDIEGATNYLMEEYRKDLQNPEVKFPELRLSSRLYPIQKLYRLTQPLFFVDTTAGRLHTYLTQLKSELRKFIKFNGKTLCNVDMVNSQPFLLQSLLSKETYIRNNMAERVSVTNPIMESDSTILIMLGVLIDNVSNEEDVILFKEIVSSGRFYEEFGRILIENGEIEETTNPDDLRNIIKEVTFSTIFSKNSSIRYVNSIKIFQRVFPNVYEVIKYVKESHHPTLAVVLQNLEADLILHKACKIISAERPDVLTYTLHDSIITTEDNVDYVQGIMTKVLKKSIGVAPTLKVERWE